MDFLTGYLINLMYHVNYLFTYITNFYLFQVRYFKASLDPPKKETRESRQLSDNIKRFLAKKDEEDKQKQLEEQKKKDELLSLRSQDKKSFKRVQSMLNRTKSANKAVIEDAKDDVNTSVTMAGLYKSLYSINILYIDYRFFYYKSKLSY